MTDIADRDLPLVSICTPTRDRLRFLPLLLRCIERQTYPRSRMEWVVVDDGIESAEELCGRFPNTRYLRLDPAAGPAPLGRKRNLTHALAAGDILVDMDDDDYYPAHRVAHAVETLRADPGKLIAGAGVTPIFFPDRDQIWLFGPYLANHATACTFAFRRELLAVTSYEDGVRCSEEKFFLKNYSIPMAALDPALTILALSHPGNTFDKRQLLVDPPRNRARLSDWSLSGMIPDSGLRAGYLAAVSGVYASRS